ncbi:hypothetical protein EDC01DRAFT_636945 [Geopyxis carbonaria]|nr:hypothetical protein EDC01DRAFT_636945 [Geopyxis carbonaria]
MSKQPSIEDNTDKKKANRRDSGPITSSFLDELCDMAMAGELDPEPEQTIDHKTYPKSADKDKPTTKPTTTTKATTPTTMDFSKQPCPPNDRHKLELAKAKIREAGGEWLLRPAPVYPSHLLPGNDPSNVEHSASKHYSNLQEKVILEEENEKRHLKSERIRLAKEAQAFRGKNLYRGRVQETTETVKEPEPEPELTPEEQYREAVFEYSEKMRIEKLLRTAKKEEMKMRAIEEDYIHERDIQNRLQETRQKEAAAKLHARNRFPRGEEENFVGKQNQNQRQELDSQVKKLADGGEIKEYEGSNKIEDAMEANAPEKSTRSRASTLKATENPLGKDRYELEEAKNKELLEIESGLSQVGISINQASGPSIGGTIDNILHFGSTGPDSLMNTVSPNATVGRWDIPSPIAETPNYPLPSFRPPGTRRVSKASQRKYSNAEKKETSKTVDSDEDLKARVAALEKALLKKDTRIKELEGTIRGSMNRAADALKNSSQK